MSKSSRGRLRRFFNRFSGSRGHSARRSVYRQSLGYGIESLETRRVFAAPTLADPPDVTLNLGAPLQVVLDGADADNDGITYTVSSNNTAAVVAELRPSTNRSVRIHVSHASSGAGDPAFEGDLVFELFEDLAPRTTQHFIQLANQNPSFFNDIIFHRVIDGFVVQGGDPTGTGTGGSNLGRFDDEFHPDLQHTSRGLLSMAKSLDDTNDSQFFVTLAPTRHLDYNHSIFGRLIEGDNILEMMSNVAVVPNDPTQPEHPTNNPRTRPAEEIVMSNVEIINDIQNATLTIKSAPGATNGAMATITVTASDGQGGEAQQTFQVTTANDSEDAPPFFGEIDPIETKANTPITVNLPFTNVDDGATPVFVVTTANTADLEFSINAQTGALTVTPKNGIFGVRSVNVVVHDGRTNQNIFDQQAVPIYISPAAPAAPDLVAVSDTGSSNTDNTTRLDNSTAGNVLQFVVNNVVAGAEVRLLSGTDTIGMSTVPTGATSITITTNGTVDLADGARPITATQTLVGQTVNVGNLMTTVNLASDPSTALAMTVDTGISISSTAPLTASVGSPYTYDVQSSDEEGPGFEYTFLENPTGATINPANGQISWVPNIDQVGDQDFSIRATDLAGNTTDQNFTVVVTNTQTGQPPVITDPPNQTASEGVPFAVDVEATDPNLPTDTLTWSLVGTPPAGMQIGPTTGLVVWTPGESFGGQTVTVTVRVTDSFNMSDEESFDITVSEVNQAPVLAAIGNKAATVGQALTFTAAATDADLPAQTLTFSLGAGAPSGATITPAGVFSWTPTAAHLPGPHTITIQVSDGTATDSETITVTVAAQVTAVRVVNGDLIVEGTTGNDSVTIRGTATAGQYDVTGSLGTTTVNGVTGDMQMTLGEGNDTVILSGAFVAGEINIDAGAGNDDIQLGDQAAVSSAQNLSILLGAGDDKLRTQRVYIVGSETVDGGAGLDQLNLMGVASSTQFWVGSSSIGTTTINGGDGDDQITLSYAVNVGATTVNAGAGNDSVNVVSSAFGQSTSNAGNLTVTGAAGNDLLAVDASYFVREVVLDGGLDSDNLILKNSIVLVAASITGGDGHDLSEVTNSTLPMLSMNQGAGQDAATVRASVLDRLFADMGNDNDALTLESSIMQGVADVSGGAGGSDLLNSSRGNLFRSAFRRQLFEAFG
jgi:cyclophilin family peptidyl-prolyl cis-trans isomerase